MSFPRYEQMSREEDERAAELYRFGYSQPEVARRIGRSRKAVRQALKRTGVQPRSSAQGYIEWLERYGSVKRRAVSSVFHLATK